MSTELAQRLDALERRVRAAEDVDAIQRLKARYGQLVDARYDNSAFNPFNPDPERTVPYGDRTIDEMMFGFVFFLRKGEDLGLRVDPTTGRAL